MSDGFAIVTDIGKTHSKVTLWSRDGTMLDRQMRPNAKPVIEGIRRLDVCGIGHWVVEALAAYAGQPVEYVVPVGHGAGVAGIVDGGLAFAPLDYEQPVPGALMAEYRSERDPFALTGSPPLPDGLNLGAQLYWLDRLEPQAMHRATLLPWAQYWGWFLSGEAVSEPTSLGCHSDLWCPISGTFSPMARRLGWADRFAPLVAAGQSIGNLRPELASRTGLPASARVLAGLHDSNAALLAAQGFAGIMDGEATVLSTGTWFVAMRLGALPAELSKLDEARDCLVNVSASGQPVPSARWMGGREIETLFELDTRRIDIRTDQPALLEAVSGILTQGAMVLPTLAPGFGPFRDGKPRWLREPHDWHARGAAASLYAALVTDVSLDLVGAQRALLIEGRFADAQVFVRALAALRPDMAVYTASAQTDVSFGALRLIEPRLAPHGGLTRIEPLADALYGYRQRWLAAIDGSLRTGCA